MIIYLIWSYSSHIYASIHINKVFTRAANLLFEVSLTGVLVLDLEYDEIVKIIDELVVKWKSVCVE